MIASRLRTHPSWAILLAALLCAALLAAPGQTITTVYVNDLLIFLDGAHRISVGQVPNRDFHTALGPLAFYLPAAGYWLSGNLGSALPTGMALTVLTLAPVFAHVLSSRLAPLVALPLGLFLLLILAVPMNLGESIGSLSFAMFYNRIGWAALALLLIMYLPARAAGPRQIGLDTACATFLALVTIYTKATYGVVALAFLSLMLIERRQRLWAISALAAVLAGALLVEAFWQSSGAHIEDLLLASRVSGAMQAEELVLGFLRHLADYVLFAALAVLVLWQRWSWRHAIFFAFCAVPGLLIVSQNSQPWGIITLQAGAAVAAQLAIDANQRGLGRTSISAGAPVVFLALVLPTTLHCFLALGLHAGLAVARAGETFGLPRFDQIRLAQLWTPGDHQFSTRYLASIREGARALEGLPEKPEAVAVLDFVNPFSAGLGLKPPRGDSAWLHWGRNVSTEHHLPGEELFGNVRFLLEPRWGINNLPLSELYGPHIRQAYEPVIETASWTVHLRRDATRADQRTAGNLGAGPGLGHGSGNTR
ncbi:MAG TPA: hypothetical protein VGU45_01765 [Microvirga sp.]|nr:hypothetical protein [Microvirga sp.]